MKQFRNAITLVSLLAWIPQSHAADIIIDGKDLQFARWSSFWHPETPASAWPVGSPQNLSSSNPDAWAQWSFSTAPSALYDVYMWWPIGGDPTASAQITHKTGVQVITINQSINSGQWNLLGAWSLDTESSIRISNGGAGEVKFDAVKLVPDLTDGVTTPPTLTFTGDPVAPYKLSWDASYASACTASGAWEGAKPTTGSEFVSSAGIATYELECVGEGGGVTGEVVTTADPQVPDPKECADGIDNADGEDVLVDFPDDPGCESATDDDETDTVSVVECSDGIDNTDAEDTLVDMSDPGCSSSTDNDETNIPAQCNDGIDNVDAEDSLIDMADPGCASQLDNDETNAVALVECNDGIDNTDAEDALVDMSDPGCSSPSDTSEANAAVECNDGIDNVDAEDTLIDLADPGCTSQTDTSEANATVQCNDGIDNGDAEDTLVDMLDPGCSNPLDTSEVNSVSNPLLVGLNVAREIWTTNAGKQTILESGMQAARISYAHGDHDAKINWASANGKTILFMLGYGEGCDVKTEAGRQCYANRSANLATLYAGKVQYYEVWNEWNGGFGLGCGYNTPPCNDAAMYTDLLCKTHKAIKAVQPNAKVVGGAIAGANSDFLEGILKNDAGDCMDMLSLHLYVYRQSWPGHVAVNAPASVAVDRFIEVLNQRNATVIAIHGSSKDILVTEAGFQNNDVFGAARDQLVAQFITELYTRTAALPFAEGIWWYPLNDEASGPNALRYHALLSPNGTKKPAHAAYKAVAD